MSSHATSLCVWFLQRLALCMVALVGCGCGDHSNAWNDEDSVGAYGKMEGALSSSSILSANGGYGSGCKLHANGTWSVAIIDGSPLDNAALQVAKQDAACSLTVTAMRSGPGASGLYTASSPIPLAMAYASGALFTSSAGSFTGNAKISALGFTTTFALTVLVSQDVVTGSTASSTYISYDARVNSDSPLSYWHLDDSTPSAFSTDDFAGTTNATLQSRSGAVGASWTKHSASGIDAVLTSAGRVRAGGTNRSVYITSGVPSSADYTVSADIYLASLLPDDFAGVIGRASSSSTTFYFAGIVETYQLLVIQSRRFELWKFVNGIGFMLGSYTGTLTAGSTYRVSLEMHGTTIRAAVDGTERIVVTDNGITATGAAGLLLGSLLGGGQSDTTGLHVDNLSGRPLGQALDSKGTNHGLYDRGVTLGAAGAFTGSNTAVSFDGVDDYLDMTRGISNDFSIELWFKSSQGIGASNVTQWYQTAGLLDANSSSSTNDFGIGLRSDGKVLAGVGKTTCIVVVCGDDDQTIVSSGATSYNNGAWHHVVFTRTKATGNTALYLDGAAKGTLSTGATNTLDASTKLSVGRLQTGNNFFAGSIDEIAVYGSVLSAAAVLRHYQAGSH